MSLGRGYNEQILDSVCCIASDAKLRRSSRDRSGIASVPMPVLGADLPDRHRSHPRCVC